MIARHRDFTVESVFFVQNFVWKNYRLLLVESTSNFAWSLFWRNFTSRVIYFCQFFSASKIFVKLLFILWPIGYGVGLRIKRSSVRIRPWPLRWVLGQGSLLPLSQGEAFTLASISYLAILVKYILAKKKKLGGFRRLSFQNDEKRSLPSCSAC